MNLFQISPLAGFGNPTPSFWRSLQTFNISRIIVAACLLLLLNLRSTREVWLLTHLAARNICIVYLIISIGYALLKFFHQRHFIAQLLSQVLVDLCVIATLYVGSGGGRGGLSILFLFPLAGLAILAPLVLSLFYCALVTLFLLSDAVLRSWEWNDGTLISQAGIFGASYFAVAWVVSRLASNLISQEQLAEQRGNELAMQQAINRLVIADMDAGILVLDHSGRVFEMNPAAEKMLGGHLTKDMAGIKLANIVALRPLTEVLSDLVERQREKRSRVPDDDVSFVSIPSYAEELRRIPGEPKGERPHFIHHLKLRVIRVDAADILHLSAPSAHYTILFLQDVSDIENQAQQLKLASMGRLTASIAHEVRNPLSSISYAASLLSEDFDQPDSAHPQARRLLRIIDDNVGRLNQLIEDILRLSRKAKTDIQPYPVFQVVHECVQDFCETRQIEAARILVDDSVSFHVSFDPGHLFEVLTNLLSNAVRYASGKPGSIRLYAVVNPSGKQELHIQDDGAPISYEVRAHLFEPFYTTSRQGTGLGLYMARELCLNNRSLLDYEYRVESGNGDQTEATGRFVINFSETGI
ncbi:sensor histidine kinase [Undibacterium squillarum]|uniref:histidine kinase n=1 Tax=Undibacterium squillarum TaxID=1131567 RepID=A0ABQ2XZF4_9BURK|nr:ATP-binding protein [Undibacterium squillarum]GGX45794.1 sensor protein PilS [Undibacterium squillarum]